MYVLIFMCMYICVHARVYSSLCMIVRTYLHYACVFTYMYAQGFFVQNRCRY